MIAAWHGEAPPPADAIDAALSRYGQGQTARLSTQNAALFAGPRDYLGQHGGVSASFTGWIDNAAELSQALGLGGANAATLYAAAVARWDEDADRHVIGSYAATAVLADGSLHLARSPWDAPPLHYHTDTARTVASPFLRVLFAAGTERHVDWDRVVDELAYDYRSGEDRSWYRGVSLVPLGANVRIVGGKRRVNRWYRPLEPMEPGDYDEDASVARALELLDEAAGHALDWAGTPALALSGGLDSTLVGDALVRQLENGARLHAITFVPDRRWEGAVEPGTMGDERPLARLMAEAHPAIDWHVANDHVGAYDRRAREIFAASETFAPGLANVGMYHNVYETARHIGADALLTADFGNSTISDAGRPAYVEYAASGEWEQLVALLRARRGDPRALWRKLVALSLLPLFPRGLRALARRIAHPERADMEALVTALSFQARERQQERAKARGTHSAWRDFTYDRNRAEAVKREWSDADGPGRDIDLAFEQLYGVRKRDVLTYRPLVEFCMRLPTRAFAWDGVERRLARLMGRGRLPEAIRTNHLHGQHNVDWHARMTPERGTMRAVLETAREHPLLGPTLDIDRLIALLDDWPQEPDFSWENDWPRKLALPRALLAARFVGHAENRNDL